MHTNPKNKKRIWSVAFPICGMHQLFVFSPSGIVSLAFPTFVLQTGCTTPVTVLPGLPVCPHVTFEVVNLCYAGHHGSCSTKYLQPRMQQYWLLPHLWTLFARLFTLYHLSLQDFYTIALLHLQSFRFFGCSNIALHCVAHTELQLWAEMQLKKIISLYQPYSTLHCSNKWHCQASFETLGLDLFLLHPGDMQHWSWNRRFRVVQCGCNYWHKACSKKKRASKQTQCVTPIQSPAITSYKKMHQLEIYRRPREFSPPANKDYQSPWTIARKLLIPFCRVPFGRFPSISMTRVASQVACTGDPPMRLCSKPLVLAQSPEQTQVNASKMLHASAVNSNLKYTVWWV